MKFSKTMTKQILSFFILFSANSFSQSLFEKGYIINNKDEKIECYIKIESNLDTPKKVVYKIALDTEEIEASILEIKKFSYLDDQKYIRFTGKIERSGYDEFYLDLDKNPIFHEETIFLKVLMTGQASLYLYRFDDIDKFFYKTKEQSIEQLVRKFYLKPNRIVVRENNMFRQQLFNSLKCENIKYKHLEWLKYEKKSLEKLFKKYNTCIAPNEEVFVVSKYKKKNELHLNINSGIDLNALELRYSGVPNEIIGSTIQIGYRLGAELEYGRSVSKYRFVLGYNYNSFSIEDQFSTGDYLEGTTYSGIYKENEINLALRYNYPYNKKSMVFFNLGLTLNLRNYKDNEFIKTESFQHTYYYEYFDQVFERTIYHNGEIYYDISGAVFFGVGYKYNKKLSIELRLHTSRKLNGNSDWKMNLNKQSLILGYTLF
ncbi:hypothetical protein [Flavicella marina]|uniref:hypothetical protein n=1 Tax=Flavicella marina TaxID=1475951 RepID=UPI00186ABE47|nr:hypothetical protein [Flavicella marina]